MGVAAILARERIDEVVRASLRLGEQTHPEDRDRGAGEEALDRAVAIPRDGRCARRSDAEDGSAVPLGRAPSLQSLSTGELQ